MNPGKKFEQRIKESIPKDILYQRLNDSAGAFSDGENLRFSIKSPCDTLLFDGENLYTLELKSTKGNRFSFSLDEDSKKSKNKDIHYHQIKSLLNFANYKNVISGFLFNFRNEKDGTEKTYFQDIISFKNMVDNLNKKSFNEKDLLKNSPIEIEGTKLRINYRWDMEGLFVTLKKQDKTK